MIENAVIATVKNESLRDSFDRAFYAALASVWALMHLIMCVVICRHVARCKEHLGAPEPDNSARAVHVVQTIRMLSLRGTVIKASGQPAVNYMI